MWKRIKAKADVEELLAECQNFHDCCLHSMEYTSGAYVSRDGTMYPINCDRVLVLQLHQQGVPAKILQLRFEGLHRLSLLPTPPDFTCEFFKGQIALQEDEIIWASEGLDIPATEQRIFVCASSLIWEAREM